MDKIARKVTRIELDRTEMGVVFGIVILFSGLMFTFGILVGYGLGPSKAAIGHEGAELTASSHEAIEKASGDAHSRAPASVVEAKKKSTESGSELRKAFRESKQKALKDIVVKSASKETPQSVLDAEAHLNEKGAWGRKPASNREDEKERTTVETARKEQESREKAGVPKTVKSLFERAPSSQDQFAPTPGSYTAQVASFATIEEARAKVSVLRKSGFNDAYTDTTKNRSGETWYRVNIGSYAGREWAHKSGLKVVRRGLASDFVVRKLD